MGLRKAFSDDMNDSPIAANQSHLLNAMMSNTEAMRLRFYNNADATRQTHGANIFSSGVFQDSVVCFNDMSNRTPLYDDLDMCDKKNFPVKLSPIGDPLNFLEKQTAAPFKMKMSFHRM